MARSNLGDELWRDRRDAFEAEKRIHDSAVLTFTGVDPAYDVYNCSIPFVYRGKRYIYGRVERHDLWATSIACLFHETAPDTFARMETAFSYQMEDPFIAMIHGEMVLGGVHVVKSRGNLIGYSTYFYRGTDPHDLFYFTTGPANMKDIRLVQMPDGIGVFSRPEGQVGFTVISSLDELDAGVIENARIIDLVGDGGYGGVNQCYWLEDGHIGIIGHMVYPKTNRFGQTERVYVNIAAVFDPRTCQTTSCQIIGTRRCYPPSDRIRICCDGVPLDDTAFTSGIVLRPDTPDQSKVDLYSGLSDALEGRATIDNPFAGHGRIVYGGNVLSE